jgi:hypothetical protein
LYFLFFGTDGVPQQKWKIISKVTKIINNREVYEEKLSKFDTKYLEQLAKLILEDKEDN